MTLDEAIKHAREKAKEQRKDNDTCVVKEGYGCKDCAYYYSKSCIECAEEHEQLAEWLEELKEYKQLEEQGLLLKLPFDVNSEVFIVSKQFILERNCTEYVVKKLKVREFRYNHLRNFVIICEEQMGDSIVQRHLYNANKIFLTKREAEKALERLECAE